MPPPAVVSRGCDCCETRIDWDVRLRQAISLELFCCSRSKDIDSDMFEIDVSELVGPSLGTFLDRGVLFFLPLR